MRRPNVLLIYTDQQRWDALGCAPNPHIRTPHLDALAAGGARFANCFCNNPVCMPSRQSMLSGLYPSTLGTMDNGVEMPEDALTVWKVLKPYGYHAGNLGKLHFLNHATRDHRAAHPDYGFDTLIVSDEPGCYDDAYIKWVAERAPGEVERCRVSSPPAVTANRIEKHGRQVTEPYVFEGPEELTHSAFVADETIDYIRAHRERPFFAIAGFYAPHTPLNPPRRFVEMYDPATLPLPVGNPGEGRWKLTPAEWQNVKAHYYALVTHVDDQVGRILRALDEAGLRENTLVLFTSDHGEYLGDHGLIQKGPPAHDSCTHVPLIVSWPGRIAGAVHHEIIEAVDLVPTILDYCGVQAPPVMQGRSFRPLIEGRAYEPRRSAYMEFRTPFGLSIKIVRTREFWYSIDNQGNEILYDHAADPDQLRSVASDPPSREALGAMRHELVRRWFTVEKQTPLKTGPY